MTALVMLQSLPPAPELAPYIREVQRFQIAAPPAGSVLLHHMPTGNVSLWLCFGTARLTSQRYGLLPRGTLVGIHDQAEVYHFSGCGDVINVLFQIAGVRSFAPFPLSDLVNRILPIDRIWPSWVIQAIADLEAYAFPQRSVLLARLLRRLLIAPERLDQRVVGVVRGVLRSHGRSPVLGLAEQYGLSSSQLERLCRDQFGLAPKRLARLTRFYVASRLMRLESPASWAMFADDAGYADQAHFIREFRTFSGYTPAAFVQARINAEFLQYAPPRNAYADAEFLFEPQEAR